MGQAKQRGTFEERVEKAKLRNRLALGLIRQTKNAKLANLVAQHGIQRVAVSLVKTGQLENLAHAAKTASEPSPSPIIAVRGDFTGRTIHTRHRPAGGHV